MKDEPNEAAELDAVEVVELLEPTDPTARPSHITKRGTLATPPPPPSSSRSGSRNGSTPPPPAVLAGTREGFKREPGTDAMVPPMADFTPEPPTAAFSPIPPVASSTPVPRATETSPIGRRGEGGSTPADSMGSRLSRSVPSTPPRPRAGATRSATPVAESTPPQGAPAYSLVAPTQPRDSNDTFSTPPEGISPPTNSDLDELRRLLRAKDAEIRAVLAQRDALISDMESARQELTIATRSSRGVSALTEQFERLRADRDHAREQHANLLSAYRALRDEHAAVRKERDRVSEDCDRFRTERERLRAEIGRLRGECDDLRTTRDKVQGERDYLAAVRGRLEDQLVELRMAQRPRLDPCPNSEASEEESSALLHSPTGSADATGANSAHANAGPKDRAPDHNGAPRPLDDLQRIQGISPGMERALKQHGVQTFAQIAAWTDSELETMARKLGLKPKRIRKEAWVAQAHSLTGNAQGSAPSDRQSSVERERG